MAAIGGSIESASLGGRLFPVAADAEATRKIGGFENELMANGDGSARQIKTRVTWSIEGLAIEIDDSRNDQEFLQDLADSKDFFVVGVTYVSGITYQGTGQITGDFGSSNQAATATVNLGGPGKLTPQ